MGHADAHRIGLRSGLPYDAKSIQCIFVSGGFTIFHTARYVLREEKLPIRNPTINRGSNGKPQGKQQNKSCTLNMHVSTCYDKTTINSAVFTHLCDVLQK